MGFITIYTAIYRINVILLNSKFYVDSCGIHIFPRYTTRSEITTKPLVCVYCALFIV